jgi:hypothetical protein
MDVGAMPVSRIVLSLVALMLAACAQPASDVTTAALLVCGDGVPHGALEEAECRVAAGDETLHVIYAPLPAGVQSGTVTVNIIGADDDVAQTISETGVSEYLAPNVEDVDGDSHLDILIPRESGNANVTHGVWLYDRAAAHYTRVGELSGVDIQRTSEGLIAVPARSGAAEWVVSFYKLDATGLHALVSVDVQATGVSDGGQVQGQTCAVEDAPGLGELQLTRDAARAKFCAEPAAAGVFN